MTPRKSRKVKMARAFLRMVPESWRYAFFKTDHGLTFGFHDNGPFVAWDAVQARIAELEDQVAELECDLEAATDR